MGPSETPAAVPGVPPPSIERSERPRLMIAEDHRVVAAALRKLLEPVYSIVAVVHSGTELLTVLREVPADCLLLDLCMPGHHAITLIPTIRELQSGLKIVVLTMLVDRVIADACLRSGAHAFVPKDADEEEVRLAITTVLAGGQYLSPHVPGTNHPVSRAAQRLGLERLTTRQQEILLLLGQGKHAAQIAETLGVGRSTITFHLKNLMRVLAVSTSDALLQLAVLMEATVPMPPPRTRRARRKLRETCSVSPARSDRVHLHRTSSAGEARRASVSVELP